MSKLNSIQVDDIEGVIVFCKQVILRFINQILPASIFLNKGAAQIDNIKRKMQTHNVGRLFENSYSFESFRRTTKNLETVYHRKHLLTPHNDR